MQKLLPKLHGSRSKLVPILQALAYLCYEVKQELTKEQMENIFAVVDNDSNAIKYPISLEKITRMHHNAVSNGFTSYAEA
jgi:5-methylcytosine-specific restriction protein B